MVRISKAKHKHSFKNLKKYWGQKGEIARIKSDNNADNLTLV